MKTKTETKKKKTHRKVAGMGAIVTKNGTAFRVWAPHAKKVHVTGTFNEWSKRKHALTLENDAGYWYGFIEEAKAGDEYKYYIVTDHEKLIKNDPYAKQLTNSIGNAIIYDSKAYNWEGDAFVMPPWNELVIYEMHVGTFNVRKEDVPGDFASVIEKLPYLKDLGINAIEIMPPMEFPGDFSWGYNPAYPFAIESSYGGPDAFKDFVKAAHYHGIGIILDVVYNHFGPGDLDLWRFDGWSENDKGGIYFYNDWRSETPWGDTRPDYGRQEVRQYLRDNAVSWLEEFHVNGLRLDGTMFMRNTLGMKVNPANDIAEAWEFFQWLNHEVRGRFPDALIIAEDLINNEWITKPIEEGGAGFGSQWWAEFVHPVREVIIGSEDKFRNMENLKNSILFPSENAFRRVIYTESHDEVANGRARVPEEIWPGHVDGWYSKKRSTLGSAIVFTAPGIPMIFQGQEFLEDRWFADDDPLDWSRADEFNGLIKLYTEMIKLRTNKDRTTGGLCGNHTEVYHVNNDDKIIAFQRWGYGGAGDMVVVVLNLFNKTFKDYSIGFPKKGEWKVRLNTDWEGFDKDFANTFSYNPVAKKGKKDNMPYHANITIGPYTALILSQDPP